MSFKKTVRSWEKNVINSTVNSVWNLDEQGFLPSILLGRLNKEKRELIKANWLALHGHQELAAHALAQIVSENPCNKEAVISLGSLVSQIGLEHPEMLWLKLKKVWMLIDRPEKIKSNNFHFFALGTDLALRCEPLLGESAIKKIYIPFLWKYERCDKLDREPIFYWHVPKTGGTSFNTRISRTWYKNGTYYLPSHTTKLFFKTVLQLQDGVLPYISSAHLSSVDIPKESIAGYRKVVVHRDPKARALSAWRQYRESPLRRLIILPQHGFVWDFLPVKTFTEWVYSAPSDVLNVLTWTFSDYGEDLSDAINFSVPIDDLNAFGLELLDELGVNLQGSFAVDKNKTDKSIKSGSDSGVLEEYLKPDYAIFNKISCM